MQWQIRENEARYRDLLDDEANVVRRRDAEARLSFSTRRSAGVLDVAARLC